jgi:hypothetical protein
LGSSEFLSINAGASTPAFSIGAFTRILTGAYNE